MTTDTAQAAAETGLSSPDHSPDLGAFFGNQTPQVPAESFVVRETVGQTVLSDEPLLATPGRLVVMAQHLLPHQPEVSITLIEAEQGKRLNAKRQPLGIIGRAKSSPLVAHQHSALAVSGHVVQVHQREVQLATVPPDLVVDAVQRGR